MKTKARRITDAEWRSIRCWRGRIATGFSDHDAVFFSDRPPNPKLVGKTYFWPMGLQPDEKIRLKIARRCPLAAAKAFLALYEKGGDRPCLRSKSRPE